MIVKTTNLIVAIATFVLIVMSNFLDIFVYHALISFVARTLVLITQRLLKVIYLKKGIHSFLWKFYFCHSSIRRTWFYWIIVIFIWLKILVWNCKHIFKRWHNILIASSLEELKGSWNTKFQINKERLFFYCELKLIVYSYRIPILLDIW